VRRAVSIVAVLGALAVAVLLSGAAGEDDGGRTYRLEFDNAFGLVEGGDLRVGGVKAGSTTGFDVVKRKGESPKAVVEIEITEQGLGDFREDATCEIKPQSLIGEYYVDCQPGSSPKKLAKNGVVPVDQTASTIPVDLVNNVLRRPYKERFRLILTELGTGLAGRPDDLQEVLRRAHPGLRETSRTLQILGRQNRVIESFIRDSDTVVAELERNKRDVVRWIRETGETAEATAERREELRAGLRRFPTFLDELTPTMRRLGELADQQTPLLADARRAAPSLDTFFERLGPFSEASRPAVDALGETSAVATQAFRRGDDELDELRALATEAPAMAKPLRQFLETSDDRRRAIENDPRAKASAPPAPDPTAIPGEGGFTGLEAIWNYFYWQALSVNMIGNVGGATAHILRASLTVDEQCSQFRTEPPQNESDRKMFERCNAFLGPNQPGLKGLGAGWETADPLDDADPASALRTQAGKPATRVGEERSAGQPEAGPLPGQRDISQPQVTLPPQVQDLLDSLKPKEREQLPPVPELEERLQEVTDPLTGLLGGGGGAQPGGGGATTDQLLDYLLAP
jgi:phospholipid/cholesterol/gamma-HCH transport system substrate-binding protein